MASARLSFRPPSAEDIVALEIYEAPAASGPFGLIETVALIGAYPNYIERYTTTLASSATNWFAIRWVDSKGAKSDLSESIQGGKDTVVFKLVERIELRNPSVSEGIAVEIAEYVVSTVLNAADPYNPLLKATYRQMEGMTLLALAQFQLGRLASDSQSTGSWTAGLVSMKSGNTYKLTDITALLKQAAIILGYPTSRVAHMIPPQIAGGLSQVVTADISRLLIEVE